MSGNEPICGDGSARSSQGSAEPLAAAEASQGARYLKLLCVAGGVSALAVLLLVLLSPPADSIENALSPTAGSKVIETVDSHDHHSDLALPLQAEEMDVEETAKVLVDLAEKLLESYPRDAGALYVAGMAYSEMQQSTRAEQLLRRCVDLSPKEPLAYLALAENLMLGAKGEEAAEVLEDAIAQDNKPAGVILRIADALANLGQLEKATGVLREGVRDFPADSLMWLRLGQMQIQVRRFPEAEASIRRALNLGDVGPSALAALSTSLLRQGKREEAMEASKRLADLRSQMESQAGSTGDGFQTAYAKTFRQNVIHWLVAGAGVYLEHGEPRRAETLLKRAIAIDPQQTQSYMLLATVYERDGRLPDLMVVLHRLIDVDPETVRHYTNLARIALQLGKDDLAESVLLQAVQIDAEGGLAHSLLAALYVSQGRNAEARKLAQIAADRARDFDAYYLLMVTCRAVGDRDAANEALQKARQLAPDDPRLHGIRL